VVRSHPWAKGLVEGKLFNTSKAVVTFEHLISLLHEEYPFVEGSYLRLLNVTVEEELFGALQENVYGWKDPNLLEQIIPDIYKRKKILVEDIEPPEIFQNEKPLRVRSLGLFCIFGIISLFTKW
jgi:hypothetical protein